MFREDLPYGGLWLDMNELASFCNGECNPFTKNPAPTGDNDLPYAPGGSPLSEKTLSINARHYDGVTELFWHNINGLMQNMVTRKNLNNLGL